MPSHILSSRRVLPARGIYGEIRVNVRVHGTVHQCRDTQVRSYTAYRATCYYYYFLLHSRNPEVEVKAKVSMLFAYEKSRDHFDVKHMQDFRIALVHPNSFPEYD